MKMNMQWLSLTFVFFTTLAHAQWNSNPWPDRRPTPPPGPSAREVKKCTEFFEELDQLYKTKTGVNKFCNSNFGVSQVENVGQFIKECAAAASKIKLFDKINFVSRCANESNFRMDMRDKNYIACLEKTSAKPIFAGSEEAVCDNFEFKTYSKDPRLETCFSFMQAADKTVPVMTMVSTCAQKKMLDAFAFEDFKSCVGKLQPAINDISARMNHCRSQSNQGAEHIKDLLYCSQEITRLFPKNGGRFCMELGFDLNKISSKNVACIENTLASLHGDFIDGEMSVTATEKFKRLIKDCDSDYDRPDSNRVNGRVSFLGAAYVKSTEEFEKTRVGGLSGLTYDQKSGILYAVSDDVGRFNDNRIYSLKVNLDEGFKLDFVGLHEFFTGTIANFAGDGFSFSNIDAEGIALDDLGNFIVSSETLIAGSNTYLKVYSAKTGKEIDTISLDKKFTPKSEYVTKKRYESVRVKKPKPTPTPEPEIEVKPVPSDSVVANKPPVKPTPKPKESNEDDYEWVNKEVTYQVHEQTRGIQFNKGFETLASVPGNRKILFTANESTLVQDNQIPGVIRIAKLDKPKNKYVVMAEYVYRLENEPDNGIVDILPLDENNLFILERSYDGFNRKLKSRIFKVNLSGARDYKEIVSINEEKKISTISMLKKELILDLDQLKRHLPAGFRFIDNIEGISFGPETKSGKKSILLVSDNNLSDDQVTQFIALELE